MPLLGAFFFGFVPMFLFAAFVNWLDRYEKDPKILLIIGLLGLTYVSLQFCSIDVWTTSGVILGLFILRRAAQAFCHSPLTSSSLRDIPEDQVRMASGLFNLHRTLAGAVGVALTATLMDYREDVHTTILSQRQDLYPLGTEIATQSVREILIWDGNTGEGLSQLTSAVLRQKLTEEATLAGYQDLFFMFATLALVCLVPVLLMRGGKIFMTREDSTQNLSAKPSRRARLSLRSPR